MEEITTADEFYLKLKMELRQHQLLYTTRSIGRNTGGREVRFSGWASDGKLRFHIPDGINPEGIMRYLTIGEITKVFDVWEPGNDKRLAQQIARICKYKDIRKSVLMQLINTYG